MELEQIYRPIEEELQGVDRVLKSALTESENQFIVEMGAFLLASPGKRIRPALVILSTKASGSAAASGRERELSEIAAAMELIHMASLIHDDVMDHSDLRHNKPTINSRWGGDISIALGDYLYSVAFELIAASGNSDAICCISSAAKAMCEGEFLQISERGNLDLLEEDYITIVKKKTASLFVASCHIGALLSSSCTSSQEALKQYGLNFGIAFQIVDDYLDLVGEEHEMGKAPGQDMSAGEITLPVLNLLGSVPGDVRDELKLLLATRKDKTSLERIRSEMFDTDAASKTKERALSYMALAKRNIDGLFSSPYRESLVNLADFVIERGFNGLGSRERISILRYDKR